jgi:hypothetical protein
MQFFQTNENRLLRDINVAYFILPLVLLPLFFECLFHLYEVDFFVQHKESFLFANIAYIVLARFVLLDSALYIFSHNKHTVNATLMRIVMLYLEITVITILYYAIVFYIFDVFSLFHLNATLKPENLAVVHNHSFVTSVYISAVTFTTLGSGDWLPQTLNAMIAVTSEAILGVIQGGVFVAIIIYGHQNREK